MGASALLLPAGGLAAFQSAAGAAKAPPDPVSCNISATVLFGSASDKKGATFSQHPLTVAGLSEPSSAFYTGTEITASVTGCTGSTNPPGNPTSGTSTFVFTSKAVKGGKTGSPPGSAKGTFWVDVCNSSSAVSSSTLKTLKSLSFSTTWTGGAAGTSSFKGHSASVIGNNEGEAGYSLSGTVKGSYATNKFAAQFNAFLVNDADANAFLDGCSTANGGDLGSDSGQTGQVSGFHIDGSTSTATL